MRTDRDHLDAETVAAWIDGGLDNASVAAAEAHASNCERCQALLATVMKTTPETGSVETQTGSVTQTGSLKAASISGWWRWWMAPIAATAAAVTLWMVVPQEQLEQKAASPPATDVAAPAAARARDEAAPPMAQATQPSDQPPGRRSPAESSFAEVRRTEKPQTAEGRLGAAAATNVVDTVGAKDRRENKAEERLARVDAEPARPAAAPAAPAPSAAAPAEAVATRDAQVTQLRKQTAPLVLVSPDPRFRWRVTPDGIEHSVDGGRTWLPVRLPQGEVITAGTSPAPLVCWMVGRRGLVLVATDGTNFTRIPFPEPVDLTGISSPELRIAVVTTADGRTFRTENAGRAWIRQ